jgi:hypothetical protein
MQADKTQYSSAISVITSDTVNIPDPAMYSGAGTSTSVVSNKLVDSAANFNISLLGGTVYNTTDGTCANIVSVVSSTQLLLSVDIFTSTAKVYNAYQPTKMEGFAVYVGTSASKSLKVITMSGQTVTFVNVIQGTILPVNVSRVLKTGTDATNLIALR